MNKKTVSTSLALLVLAGCAVAHVTVAPSGGAARPAPKPADCRIEFFRTKPPERPYDEIAGLHFGLTVGGFSNPRADDAQEALRAKACALGADAVIVTREFTEHEMVGTAVVFR